MEKKKLELKVKSLEPKVTPMKQVGGKLKGKLGVIADY